MSWSVDFTADAWASLLRLDEIDQETVSETLFSWTESGPPRRGERVINGWRVYDEDVSASLMVTYLVHEEEQRFVVVRIRQRPGRR